MAGAVWNEQESPSGTRSVSLPFPSSFVVPPPPERVPRRGTPLSCATADSFPPPCSSHPAPKRPAAQPLHRVCPPPPPFPPSLPSLTSPSPTHRWKNPALTEKGRAEALEGGKNLKKAGYTHFDVAFSSVLQRANDTLAIILKEIDQEGLETFKDQALNERDYGDLTGLNKDEGAFPFL